MTLVKISELDGAALDFAVLKAQATTNLADFDLRCIDAYPFSTSWALGGPVIEREMGARQGRMVIKDEAYATQNLPVFSAEYTCHNWEQSRKMYGPTPLKAAMRCFVASKLGQQFEIPEGLS